MGKLILLSILLVGFALFGLCVNIIFRKNGEFPDGEISHNKELRKRGIICAKEEELRIWKKTHKGEKPTCSDLGCGDCRACSEELSTK